MNDTLKKTIYNLELLLLQPEIRASAKELDTLLAHDFREFGSSGEVYDKKHILELLPQFTEEKFLIHDFEIKELSENVVLATYQTDKTVQDQETPTRSLRSSIWRKVNGRWQMVFHQGTPKSSSSTDV